MADEDRPAHSSLWTPWLGGDGPFYQSCAVAPFDRASEGDGEVGQPEAQFTTGLVRLALRNVPVVLLAVLAVYIPMNLVRFTATGRLSLPAVDESAIVLAVPGVLLGIVWLLLLYRIAAPSFGPSRIHRSVVFFATALPLAAGTGIAVAVVVFESATEPAVTVQAGYFLFVLLAGHLVYDGLALRAEHLFANLGATTVVDSEQYERFYADLSAALGATVSIGPVTVSRALAFALALALGPIVLPVMTEPWGPPALVAYAAYSAVTLLVVAVLYEVVVLIAKFTELLRSDALVYQPFHPDEHGGFRDFGRFATRVNVVLVLAGGYVAYRFYAEGVLRIPDAGLDAPFLALTWSVLYLGPVLAYVALVVFWLYHSFWRMHRRMERGRKRCLEELQRDADDNATGPREFAEPDTDAMVWDALQSAPTWPIKRQGLVGIVLVDAIPAFLPLVL